METETQNATMLDTVIEVLIRKERTQWEVGDVLVQATLDPITGGFMPGSLAKLRDRVAKRTGMEFNTSTFGDYRKVAATFPEDKRGYPLTFSHYVELSLVDDPDERAELISQAVALKWTVNDLRAVRGVKPTTRQMSIMDVTPEMVSELVELAPEQYVDAVVKANPKAVGEAVAHNAPAVVAMHNEVTKRHTAMLAGVQDAVTSRPRVSDYDGYTGDIGLGLNENMGALIAMDCAGGIATARNAATFARTMNQYSRDGKLNANHLEMIQEALGELQTATGLLTAAIERSSK